MHQIQHNDTVRHGIIIIINPYLKRVTPNTVKISKQTNKQINK